ncbi:hypothetical protein [Azospirillum soli]|uniref:hypothetical protein n=1 Tax=Azospirillum soli TaxID=1304799 RepID=UPI001AE1B9CA|nr:hypothetical protein [Azospirillum soli]
MPQKRVYGTQHNDFLGADGLGTTIIYGLGGDDRLENLDSDMDVLFGGEGADRLYGLRDYLIGGPGNDTLSGSYILGGPGDDLILTTSILQYSGPRSAYEIKSVIAPGVGVVGYSIKDLRPESPDGNDFISFPKYYAAVTFSDMSDFADTDVFVPESQQTDVYRFYNLKTETHFYTPNVDEVTFIRENLPTYRYEGVGFQIPTGPDAAGAKPMYRFYNTVSESHFFTFDENERDSIIANLPSFRFEGVGMYGYTNNAVDGCQELYRFYNEATGRHFFTASESERDFVLDQLPSYRFEGLAGWVFL